MGWKSKLVEMAASVAVETLSNSGKVDDIVNNAIGNVGKLIGKEKIGSQIETKKKHCLIIKTKRHTINTFAKIIGGAQIDVNPVFWGKYKIFDDSGKMKYVTELKDTNLLADLFLDFDKETVYVFDNNDKLLGKIKENLLSFKVPLFEKDARRCTIYQNNTKFCDLKKYDDVFNNSCYSLNHDEYNISLNDEQKIKIKKGKKEIAQIHQFSPAFKEDYVEKYVVEFDDLAEEIPILLLTLAVDVVSGAI